MMLIRRPSLRATHLLVCIFCSFAAAGTALVPRWQDPEGPRDCRPRSTESPTGSAGGLDRESGITTGATVEPHGAAQSGRPAAVAAQGDLTAECRKTIGRLHRLWPECQTLVRPPLVLAGRVPVTELETIYRHGIAEAAAAMQQTYFQTTPDRPIVVLLCDDQARMNEVVQRFYGHPPPSRFGFYKSAYRTVVVNYGYGASGLWHELTHALMDFDFPDAPLWLQEGIASLHEAGTISRTGRQMTLVGHENWRGAIITAAQAAGKMPPLRSLLEARSFAGPEEAVRYAHTRYFCLYLQQRGLLSAVYRSCRAQAERDPSGVRSLRQHLGGSLSQIDHQFRTWLTQQ